MTSLLAEAFALYQAGRLTEAAKTYNQILATQPDHFDSLHLLAIVFHQRGDHAALIANLDLVISVDISVAHLAGALAKPVWILLPFMPDWRWLLDRDDSPWYPTARLFRQDKTRGWDSVMARVRAALDDDLRRRESS